MAEINQSRINFRKLISDLVDMYPDDTFDVVLSELVANALDAKASRIWIEWDDATQVLTVTDNGAGMGLSEFTEYHDFAVELKQRGSGIGFAGLGAKLSFHIADRVVTTTSRDGFARGSDWRWVEDALTWEDLSDCRLDDNGTKVEVHFSSAADVADVDASHIERVLKRTYFPLFTYEFLETYSQVGIYPPNLRFEINGRLIEPSAVDQSCSFEEREHFFINRDGEDVGVGVMGVVEEVHANLGHSYGVLLCTYGKVIKTEMFGLPTGAVGDRFFGVFEVPELVHYLTANKADLRDRRGPSRPLGRIVDAMRDNVRRYLTERGVSFSDRKRGALSARLERELKDIVVKLPELQDFQGARNRANALKPDPAGGILAEETPTTTSTGDDPSSSNGKSGEPGDANPKVDEAGDGSIRARPTRTRRRSGPMVAFEDQPGRAEVSWVDYDVITINSGHSAYATRMSSDSARLVYCMFAIAVAVEKAGVVDQPDGRCYVESFISAWGES